MISTMVDLSELEQKLEEINKEIINESYIQKIINSYDGAVNILMYNKIISFSCNKICNELERRYKLATEEAYRVTCFKYRIDVLGAIKNSSIGFMAGLFAGAILGGGILIPVGIIVGVFANKLKWRDKIFPHVEKIVRDYATEKSKQIIDEYSKHLFSIYENYNVQELPYDFDRDDLIGFSASTELEKTKEVINNREIKSLIHFTNHYHIFSILQNGLLSKIELEKRGISYIQNDANRFDNELDYISLSITIPNKYYCNKINKNELCYLVIDSRLLYELTENNCLVDRIYCQTNAATKNGFKGKTSIDFEKMFDEIVEYDISGVQRKMTREYKKSNITTDGQAEILFKRHIPPNYIKKIVFTNENLYEKYKNQYNNVVYLEEWRLNKYGQ